MNRILITALFYLSFCTTTNAQIVRGPTLSIFVMDSVTKVYLVGAHIAVVSGKDTIHSVTEAMELSVGGSTHIYEPLKDSVKVTVNYPGYETYLRKIKIIQPVGTNIRINILNVKLRKKNDLSGVAADSDMIAVITGRRSLMRCSSFPCNGQIGWNF